MSIRGNCYPNFLKGEFRQTFIRVVLKDVWDFGDVYLQARHRHPSMNAKYAEFAVVWMLASLPMLLSSD